MKMPATWPETFARHCRDSSADFPPGYAVEAGGRSRRNPLASAAPVARGALPALDRFADHAERFPGAANRREGSSPFSTRLDRYQRLDCHLPAALQCGDSRVENWPGRHWTKKA